MRSLLGTIYMLTRLPTLLGFKRLPRSVLLVLVAAFLMFWGLDGFAQSKVVCPANLFPTLYLSNTVFTCNANANDETAASATPMTIEADTPNDPNDPQNPFDHIFMVPADDVPGLQQAFMLGVTIPLIAYLVSYGYGIVINWFDKRSW